MVTTRPEGALHNRKNPCFANISKRINLNGRGSSRETLHLEIDISGSGLKYEPGDAVGIYAENSTALVESVLDLLKFSGEETVDTWHGKKAFIRP